MIVEPPQPDFRNTVQAPARFPLVWWKRIAEIAKENWRGRGNVAIQLLRWSLDQPERPTLIEGPELVGAKQKSIALTPARWKQIDDEAKARGLSRNKVLQCHLARAFAQYDRERRKR